MKEKQDSKQSIGLLSRSKEHLVSKKNSTIAPIPSNSKHISPSVERQLVKERQLYRQKERMLLKRKRNPYMDEMDDFIDDEDVDDPADVSKYIKEIFGYDRSRFVSLLQTDLHLTISIYILHSLAVIFPLVLTRRISLTIKSYLN